jgi:hypothetical protein
MIRFVHEKNNDSDYTIWMDMFNNFINDTALINIVRGDSMFTWTNKQNNPIRSVMDRVFVSKEWEQKFPKVKLMTLTRVGSDHCPLLLDDGTRDDLIKRGFRFEVVWLSQGGFREKLIGRWPVSRGEDIQDFWKRMKKEVRQPSKGKGANLDGEIRRRADKIMRVIKWLDSKAEAMEIDENGWRLRYELEREMEEIYTYKESIWQIRCSERWILQGDANTRFFHSVANRRRRKCTIQSLETEEGKFSEPTVLRTHIEDYYRKLFEREERGDLRLNRNLWETKGSLSEEDAVSLVVPFTEKEIKEALDDMNTSSALGTNGLPVEFYKSFWEQVRAPVLEMFGKLYSGELNMSRLNYGLISLIPKLKEANTIKQFRPICLLGVDYKWFIKGLFDYNKSLLD